MLAGRTHRRPLAGYFLRRRGRTRRVRGRRVATGHGLPSRGRHLAATLFCRRCNNGAILLRYRASALALKAFSATPLTRRLYRGLGNCLRRAGVTHLGGPAGNAAWLIANAGPISPATRAAEIGTGWLHFYGIAMCLAGLSSLDAYDVWDNRQLRRLKATFASFGAHIAELGVSESRQQAARDKLKAMLDAKDWRELYDVLGLTYSLEPLRNASYDVIFSVDVLEHVRAGELPSLIRRMFDALAPGGLSLHHIGLDDHLTHYDRRASSKQYLAFTESQWRRLYDNDVQHFNRISCKAIRRMFAEAGFEEIACTRRVDEGALDGIVVAPQFRAQSREDLLTTWARLVHRKPAQ